MLSSQRQFAGYHDRLLSVIALVCQQSFEVNWWKKKLLLNVFYDYGCAWKPLWIRESANTIPLFLLHCVYVAVLTCLPTPWWLGSTHTHTQQHLVHSLLLVSGCLKDDSHFKKGEFTVFRLIAKLSSEHLWWETGCAPISIVEGVCSHEYCSHTHCVTLTEWICVPVFGKHVSFDLWWHHHPCLCNLWLQHGCC